VRAAHNLELIELQTKDATSVFLQGFSTQVRQKRKWRRGWLTTSVFRQRVLDAALGSRAATRSQTLILPS